MKSCNIPTQITMHRRTLLQAALAGTITTLTPRPSYAASTPLVICEGNSITDTESYFVTPWYQFIHNGAVWVSTAVAGLGVDRLIARAPEMVYPLLDAWQGRKIVVLWEGTNNLADVKDARRSWQLHADYADALRSHGAAVIIGTILPRSYDFGFDFEAARLEWNAIARGEWRNHADGLMDVAQDERLKPNTSYFVDHSHPSTAGQQIIAGIAAPVIAGVLRVVQPQVVKPASCLAFPVVGR